MTDFLRSKIQQRITDQSLRSLSNANGLIDFCSNDYLGFSRNQRIHQELSEFLSNKDLALGSTGSRLISGNSAHTEQLEQQISNFHSAESGLLFNSGFDANLGLLSSVPQKGDTIIVDELIHASIIDGCRLSLANKFNFRHNNLDDLETKLRNARGNIFVVTESVFSMDGDSAPLSDMVSLCQRYKAHLVVDEAHATGVFGEQGRGMVCALGLENEVFARVLTFGKALGSHGAIVLGNALLREFLINFARSFIYTTALPPHSVFHIQAAYEEMKHADHQKILHQKILLFKQHVKGLEALIPSESAIQSVIVPGNSHCKDVAEKIREAGFHVKAILHPTVARGSERLRICLHSFNSDQEIKSLTEILKRHL